METNPFQCPNDFWHMSETGLQKSFRFAQQLRRTRKLQEGMPFKATDDLEVRQVRVYRKGLRPRYPPRN